jgi:hypothetical protein
VITNVCIGRAGQAAHHARAGLGPKAAAILSQRSGSPSLE